MLKETELIIWKDFRQSSVNRLWEKINDLYADGWTVAVGPFKSRDDVSIITGGRFKVTMVRESVELTLNTISNLSKIADLQKFSEENDVKFDKELLKQPMKFKKYLRDYFTPKDNTKPAIVEVLKPEIVEPEPKTKKDVPIKETPSIA